MRQSSGMRIFLAEFPPSQCGGQVRLPKPEGHLTTLAAYSVLGDSMSKPEGPADAGTFAAPGDAIVLRALDRLAVC